LLFDKLLIIMKKTIAITISALLIISIYAFKHTEKEAKEKKPKKVIIMIGDGMGLAQITGAMSNYQGRNAFERFQVIGLSKTHSADDYVTDSGAGATAISIGKRTYNNAIGVDADSMPMPTLFELVKKIGWSTGVVATSSIVHATPASFYAHVTHRRQYENIAEQLLNGNCDIAIGGGYKFFEQRKDNRSLLTELQAKGFTTSADSSNWQNIRSDKMVYLNAYDGMPRMLDGRGDFLTRASKLAIFNANRNPNGMMLMIEGSQIDWGGHAMDFEYMQTELWDFNDCINEVLNWAEKQKDVLVIVTADHETGGLALTENRTDKKAFIPKYTYNEHTGIMVPVFAFGPGSENFSGIYDNTAIFIKLKNLLDLK
jgi:alkaline phosphatase